MDVAVAVGGWSVVAILVAGTAPLWFVPAVSIAMLVAGLALVSAVVAGPVWLAMRLWRAIRPADALSAARVPDPGGVDRPAGPQAIREAAERGRRAAEIERMARTSAEAER